MPGPSRVYNRRMKIFLFILLSLVTLSLLQADDSTPNDCDTLSQSVETASARFDREVGSQVAMVESNQEVPVDKVAHLEGLEADAADQALQLESRCSVDYDAAETEELN